MKTIGASEKIMDISEDKIQIEVSRLLLALVNDVGSALTQKVFDHTYQRIAYFLKSKHKNLAWYEIEKIFENISDGTFSIKKVSTYELMGVFAGYQLKKIESNKEMIRAREYELEGNWVNLHQTPYGQAINYRITMKERKKAIVIPLKEIAEKIATGLIRYQYIPISRARKFYY